MHMTFFIIHYTLRKSKIRRKRNIWEITFISDSTFCHEDYFFLEIQADSKIAKITDIPMTDRFVVV